jgi:hypothetical protein
MEHRLHISFTKGILLTGFCAGSSSCIVTAAFFSSAFHEHMKLKKKGVGESNGF